MTSAFSFSSEFEGMKMGTKRTAKSSNMFFGSRALISNNGLCDDYDVS